MSRQDMRGWEGCPQCGHMGDRHWRFVKVDTGEEAYEASRIQAEQAETIRLYGERVRGLLNEVEALKIQLAFRQPANVGHYEPVQVEG